MKLSGLNGRRNISNDSNGGVGLGLQTRNGKNVALGLNGGTGQSNNGRARAIGSDGGIGLAIADQKVAKATAEDGSQSAALAVDQSRAISDAFYGSQAIAKA